MTFYTCDGSRPLGTVSLGLGQSYGYASVCLPGNARYSYDLPSSSQMWIYGQSLTTLAYSAYYYGTTPFQGKSRLCMQCPAGTHTGMFSFYGAPANSINSFTVTDCEGNVQSTTAFQPFNGGFVIPLCYHYPFRVTSDTGADFSVLQLNWQSSEVFAKSSYRGVLHRGC